MAVDLSFAGTQEELADLVGVSQPTISQLMSAGKLPAHGTLGELVLSYCHRLREQAAARTGADMGGLDLVQERAMLAREQRLRLEIKNTLLRSEFAPAPQLAEILCAVSQLIAGRLGSLASEINRGCPGLTERARQTLSVAILQAQSEWGRSTAQLPSAIPSVELYGGDLDAEALDL